MKTKLFGSLFILLDIVLSSLLFLHESDFDKKIIMIVFLNVTLCLSFWGRRYIYSICSNVWKDRKLVWSMAKTDFSNKFAGSFFGVFWAFTQPIVVITIYWFVFSVGFKSAPVEDFPYLLWLISGICPWFFANDSINSGTGVMFEYGYIVKKMSFNLDIIPVVRILSCGFIHFFFVLLIFFVFIINGKFPTCWAVQVIYYSFCTFAFSLAVVYITSSLACFFKDLTQIVNILLQLGMWTIPIMYSETMFTKIDPVFFKINPLYYVVRGYRDSLIYHMPIGSNLNQTVYFWCVTGVLFVIGARLYKKMQAHFVDML